MITLSDGTTTIELNEDLQWVDEFDWHPVAQFAERTVTGVLIIEAQARVGGRSITLAPNDEESGGITRATLSQVAAWAAIPGKQLTLTIDGVARQVLFRHHDEAGVVARPFVFFSDPASDDLYMVTLRFIEVV